MLKRIAFVFGSLVLSAALAACGGASSSIDTSAKSPLTPDQWAAFSHGTPAPHAAGLPAIPLDSGTARSSSGTVGNSVLGADFLEDSNCTVEGTSLRLNPDGSANPSGGSASLGWAMYKIGGLSGLNAISLNVECLPAGLSANYFVGVADYSHMVWNWSSAVNLPEYQFDLSKDNSRYITNLGNLYFVIACYGDSVALHSQSTVVTGGSDGGQLPGAPMNLIASKGEYPDGIVVYWQPGAGAGQYELQRSISDDPALGGGPGNGSDWQTIATLQEPKYFDSAVDLNTIYVYRARSINSAGSSVWSNTDFGYTGNTPPPPPPDKYALQGTVYSCDGGNGDPNGGGKSTPLAGVTLEVISADGSVDATTQTDDTGYYFVDALQAGSYVVTPSLDGWSFQPNQAYFQISDQSPSAWVDFCGTGGSGGGGGGGGGSTAMVFGYVFTNDQNDPSGATIPLPGATLTVVDPSGAAIAQATSNEKGYYEFVQLPPGVYHISAALDGYYFGDGNTFQLGANMPGLEFDFLGKVAP